MNEKCKICIHYIDKNDMGSICHYCNIKEGDKEIFELRGCEKYIRRDLVQVIRCKDCIFSQGFAAFACPMVGRVNLKDNDFCSRGERRTK